MFGSFRKIKPKSPRRGPPMIAGTRLFHWFAARSKFVQVIPVVDILGGRVVHAVAGNRQHYQPLHSPLLDVPTTPASLARLFVADWELEHIYLADLDAISGAEPHWHDYSVMLDLGARLWIDAGITSPEAARRLADFRSTDGRFVERVILGLESTADESLLHETIAAVGAERAVFSLDLESGRPRTRNLAWRDWAPRRVAARARDAGFRRFIVLDLRRVGTGSGPGTTELLCELIAEFADVEWIAGGGVRGPEDLATLREVGCSAALVASAIHHGKLPRTAVRL